MNKIVRNLFIHAFSISASILLAQQTFGLPLPHINEGESYVELREELLRIGYQPLEKGRAQDFTTTTVYRETGWDELQACSGTGLGLCKFAFIDNYGKVLSITTYKNYPEYFNKPYLIYGWDYR